MRALIFIIVFLASCSKTDENIMTQDEMEKIVIKNVELIEQKKGYLVFKYNKVQMVLISDENHDRMRIITPITEYSKLTEEQKHAAMESNFHSALDARYAVSNGLLYSAFIHPMSPLTSKQLEDALNQVSSLALSFGSSYSSGSLSYGGKKIQKPSQVTGI